MSGKATLVVRKLVKLGSDFMAMIEMNSEVKLMKLQAMQMEKRRKHTCTIWNLNDRQNLKLPKRASCLLISGFWLGTQQKTVLLICSSNSSSR